MRCKNTSALTQTVARIKNVALSFKMTPTLCQSNTMLAIPYSEHESCIFV